MTSFLILVALMTHLQAQEKDQEKISWSTDMGMTYSLVGISQRVEMQLGIMATIKNHQFRAAPLIHLWSSEAANNPKKLSLSGFALNYYYTIPTYNKRFDLFFRYEMAFQFYTNKWDGTYYNPKVNGYQTYSDESREFFYANSVAYGFTFHPTTRVFFRLDAGGGVYLSTIDGNYEDYYGQSGARFDFRGYKDTGVFMKLSVSVGYTF